jgi:hypothetical protein
MSTAPRPYSIPARVSGVNGGLLQPSPAGTTSRCPAKAKWRLPAGPRRTARQFSTAPPATKRWTSKPNVAIISSNTSNTAPLAGVTLSQAIRRSAKLTTWLEFPIIGGLDERPGAYQPEQTTHAQDRPRCDPADQPDRLSGPA